MSKVKCPEAYDRATGPFGSAERLELEGSGMTRCVGLALCHAKVGDRSLSATRRKWS